MKKGGSIVFVEVRPRPGSVVLLYWSVGEEDVSEARGLLFG